MVVNDRLIGNGAHSDHFGDFNTARSVFNLFVILFQILVKDHQLTNKTITFSANYGIDGVPIYDSLIGCYRGNETQPLFPNSLPLLIELIRKVEDASAHTMNARMLSTLLLHTLRIDGIEREPTVRESALVTPYGADGLMTPKFMLLLRMISNTTNTVDIRSAMTLSEMCQLHRMISATVDPWERGDESVLCPLQNRNINTAARRQHSIRPFE